MMLSVRGDRKYPKSAADRKYHIKKHFVKAKGYPFCLVFLPRT